MSAMSRYVSESDDDSDEFNMSVHSHSSHSASVRPQHGGKTPAFTESLRKQREESARLAAEQEEREREQIRPQHARKTFYTGPRMTIADKIPQTPLSSTNIVGNMVRSIPEAWSVLAANSGSRVQIVFPDNDRQSIQIRDMFKKTIYNMKATQNQIEGIFDHYKTSWNYGYKVNPVTKYPHFSDLAKIRDIYTRSFLDELMEALSEAHHIHERNVKMIGELVHAKFNLPGLHPSHILMSNILNLLNAENRDWFNQMVYNNDGLSFTLHHLLTPRFDDYESDELEDVESKSDYDDEVFEQKYDPNNEFDTVFPPSAITPPPPQSETQVLISLQPSTVLQSMKPKSAATMATLAKIDTEKHQKFKNKFDRKIEIAFKKHRPINNTEAGDILLQIHRDIMNETGKTNKKMIHVLYDIAQERNISIPADTGQELILPVRSKPSSSKMNQLRNNTNNTRPSDIKKKVKTYFQQGAYGNQGWDFAAKANARLEAYGNSLTGKEREWFLEAKQFYQSERDSSGASVWGLVAYDIHMKKLTTEQKNEYEYESTSYEEDTEADQEQLNSNKKQKYTKFHANGCVINTEEPVQTSNTQLVMKARKPVM